MDGSRHPAAKASAAPGALRLANLEQGRLSCGPETLQINLQNACNLNCTFCWNHSPLTKYPAPAWYKERLSDAHLDNVLASVPRLMPGRVQLSGRGEPLLHPGAQPLLETLQGLGVPVTIQTNGVGGLEPEALVELGVERLAVNISAGTPSGYEAVHPGRGQLFEKVVERLTRVSKRRGDQLFPAITLVMVIHEHNHGELLPAIATAARVGATSVMFKGMEFRGGLESLLLSEGAREKIRALLPEVAREAARVGVEAETEHLEQIVRKRQGDGSFTPKLAAGPCYMGWYYLRVTCDGRVMFCCKDKPMGQLSGRSSLYDIWRSPSYHLQRLAGRDGDTSTGLFDRKCRACSNFARNRAVHQLRRAASQPKH